MNTRDIDSWIDGLFDTPNSHTNVLWNEDVPLADELVDLPDELIANVLNDMPTINHSNPAKKRKRQTDKLKLYVHLYSPQELKNMIKEMDASPDIFCKEYDIKEVALFYQLKSYDIVYGEARYEHTSILAIIDKIRKIAGPLSEFKNFFNIDNETAKMFSTSTGRLDGLFLKWFNCPLRPLADILRHISDSNYARLKEMNLGTFANPSQKPDELLKILKQCQSRTIEKKPDGTCGTCGLGLFSEKQHRHPDNQKKPHAATSVIQNTTTLGLD